MLHKHYFELFIFYKINIDIRIFTKYIKNFIYITDPKTILNEKYTTDTGKILNEKYDKV